VPLLKGRRTRGDGRGVAGEREGGIDEEGHMVESAVANDSDDDGRMRSRKGRQSEVSREILVRLVHRSTSVVYHPSQRGEATHIHPRYVCMTKRV
jgi:hypothetical protein